MKEQLIKVKTPNKMLFIKGKLSRTPLEAVIKSEQELNLLKSSMIHQGIDFTIEKYVKPEPKEKQQSVLIDDTTEEKQPVKKKISNPKTILEKISNEDDE